MVLVGERGRGRHLIRVPIPRGALLEEGRVVAVPTRDPRDAAVVLIRDQSGFRGTWHLCQALLSLDTCPGEKEGILGGRCPYCQVWADYGHARPFTVIRPEEIGRVIALGRCAQGAAGRAGGGQEVLVVARAGAFGIRRTGRLYGAPEFLTVRVTPDGQVEVIDAIAELETEQAGDSW
jgi:hypothetical protein